MLLNTKAPLNFNMKFLIDYFRTGFKYYDDTCKDDVDDMFELLSKNGFNCCIYKELGNHFDYNAEIVCDYNKIVFNDNDYDRHEIDILIKDMKQFEKTSILK